MKGIIKVFLELGKFRISLLAAISAASGYILATGKFSWEILVPTFGIFFMSNGSCTINQIQDREFDRLMDRTKHRPLPSGRISLSGAWFCALASLLIGGSLLYFGANLITLSFGLLALVWYNVVYMVLKRVSSWAVVPGSLIGAIPPIVGWTASGRNIMDPSILSVAFLFFIWQVPHFWLLILNYRRDYAKSGLPMLTDVFSIQQLSRITFMWIVATAVTGILMPFYGNTYSVIASFLLLAMSLWLVATSVNLLKINNLSFMKAFMNINLYILAVVMIISIEKLWSYGKPGLTLLVER